MLGRIISAIDRFNLVVGYWVAWLALLMVLVQFTVVILRYVFAIGFIPMQESIWYLHGVLFMAGAGYTLLYDGHVRVDIFYREASFRRKAMVDLGGCLAFLMPICILTFWLSWGYVTNSWAILESSTEVSGLPLIYLLKTMIWVFALVVGLQGISMMARAVRYLRGETDVYRAGLPGAQVQ